MLDDEQDPAEEITSPEALASALAYLHAEARLAGFDFVAHLILVAATAIEEDQREDGDMKQPPAPPPRNCPPALRLLRGGKAPQAAAPDNRQGDRQ